MSTHRGSMGAPSASVVPTTAPVLDYVCLFTHDLKRKQKRWQDGKLKYHTFNKRVMVYDEKANFIGDMHWNEDYDFGDGEEFQLERGCVIVQVAECIGSKEQDLSELIEKRYKDKEQRQARAAAASGATPSRSRPSTAAPVRPLADVSTTPRANYIGRAVVPTESPFEQRQAQNGDTPSENNRPAKRRKADISPPSKSGYAQNLFGAPLSLSSWSASGQIRRSQETGDNQQARAAPSAIPSGPIYRSQAPASLLQKIRRDQPLDRSVLAEGTGNPMTARQTFSARPQAASTTAPRSDAPPSNQQKQPARPKSQKATFGRGTDATPKETPSRPARDAPTAVEVSSDEDVVETFCQPIRPSLSTRKRAQSPKPSPPRRTKTAPKPFSAPKPQAESRARVLGKPAPAKVVDQAPLNTPDLDDDEVVEAPMLVSTTKPSRRRRLMLVSGPQASKDIVSSVESPIPPITSRPVIRPPPVPVPEPVVSDQTEDHSPPPAKRKSLSRAPSNPFVDFDSSSDSDVPLPKRRAERPAAVSRTSRPRESEEDTDTVPDSLPKSMRDNDSFSDDEAQDFCSAQPREKSVPRQLSRETSPAPIEDPKPLDPTPAQSPAETTHRFAAAGARLATLRRGVKSKEVLFWPRDEVSSEEEPEIPKEAETKQPAATKSKSPVETMAVEEVPDTTHVTKASAKKKEPEPKEKPQRRTSSRQTQQLSKTVEQKPDSPPAEPAPAISPDTTAHQQEMPANPPASEPEPATVIPPKTTPQQELPLKRPPIESAPDVTLETVPQQESPPPAVVPEPSVPNGKAIQTNVSFHAEPAVQEPQHAKAVPTEPPKAPSPDSTSGQVAPLAKQTPPAPQDKEIEVGAPPMPANLRRSTSATSTSAPPPPNQPPQIPGQRPRIVNPATRGRKAALKTDAKGQLPQTVVPAALPLATVNQLRMAVPVPMPAAVPVPVRKETAPVEKPKLPGFSRAGGGAWSKTAHDLLGMERPA